MTVVYSSSRVRELLPAKRPISWYEKRKVSKDEQRWVCSFERGRATVSVALVATPPRTLKVALLPCVILQATPLHRKSKHVRRDVHQIAPSTCLLNAT